MNKILTRLIVVLLTLIVVSSAIAMILPREQADPNENGDKITTEESSTQETSDSIEQTTDTEETTENITTSHESESIPDTEMPPVDPAFPIEVKATHAFVYSIKEAEFLFEQGGTDTEILPASITKLLTALYALEVMPADTVITPGNELELVKSGSSIAYIKSHHKLTLEMLIEGMLLPSGNDAAYVVAAAVGRYLNGNPSMSGIAAVNYFMEKANEYARELGCTGTSYSVPDGLAYENHRTTAHDLALIASEAVENEIISKYANTVSDNVVYASQHTNSWKNTNQLIDPSSQYYCPYVTGLKTGSLTGSYSIMVSAEINGEEYIIGLFGAKSSADRFSYAKAIVEYLVSTLTTE